MNDPLKTGGSGLLDELYREIILDHYRRPRNHDPLKTPTCSADGANPLCGDTIHLEVGLDDHTIEDIAFAGAGCSISQASASMMTEYVKGRTVEEARKGAEAFQQMMTTGETQDLEGFDDIDALQGVSKFPARVKCASLAWKTLEQALEGGGVASTEEGETSHD
ncbi:MAG: SUF system NifU family Fe-S cluster assembly protein [Dehalococcoidia bacterium]|nr:SUF system NifU family Fe-S cluster assembly protein [Dehalococcoidia bacterium]MCA9856248.1 SUF system NifU family Fe-S cluster assembly protein [Dehalococcoidia bacterium]MCB9482884.1 SUF system NifU family Fe-S cluster assembly protein [Dehalococcoidia bacterium]MCB9491482.1 SUF system NifU family Fe-S cluster assembly protein [Dehalococcoidia bacterium]